MALGEANTPRPSVIRGLATWAVLIGLLVGARAVVTWSGLSPELWIILLGSMTAPFVLGRYFWTSLVVPLTVGLRCPDCSARPLRFVQATSFGYRYYCCAACRRRFKRTSLDEPWEEANSPRDLPFYQPKPKTALPTRQELGWAAIILGTMVVWPALGALGYWAGGMAGGVAGAMAGLSLVTAMHRGLARMKEDAHRLRHRDAADGFA